jgi:DNA-binding transcriptional MerR regulator
VTGSEVLPLLRIGELSRRVGVSGHVLRAWEARYGLLQPVRSEGGFRLYSEADEARIRRMQAHLAGGLSAAEAARAALSDEAAATWPDRAGSSAEPITLELAAALREALDSYDEPGAQAVIDRLLANLSLPTVLRDVVLPYLGELGDRWAAGTASVAQEHFASIVLRGRLAGLARGWGGGSGPLALLACPPGELHDLALMAFGLILNRGGWRIHYLGPSTPIEDLMRSVEQTHYDRVVLAATTSATLTPHRARLKKLAAAAPLVLAGEGATESFAAAVGAQLLRDDPVTEAERMVATHR